jgi:hypothetical protein
VNANGALSGATTGSFSGNVTTSSSVVAAGNVTGGNITTAGQVVSTGNIAGGNLLTVGNVVGGLFVGNGGSLSNIAGANITGVVANANYAANAGNITIANQPNITSLGTLASLAVTGNITGGNIAIGGAVTAAGSVTAPSVVANIDSVVGTSTKLRMTTDSTTSYVQTGTGVAGSTGNIVFAPYFSGTPRVSINTASGNLVAAGDITGTNVFSSQGRLLAASINSPVNGQLLQYNGSQWVNADNPTVRGGGQVVVLPGNASFSFTLPINATYVAWVLINIPNGIVTWNATITVTNTNVPVSGIQSGWYYNIGGAETLQLTSIPAQIRGAFQGISSDINTGGVNPTNVFTFGVINRTGVNQFGTWGYTRVS